MKGKTFQITHCCICTKDSIIVEGGEYFYKEGSFKKRALLEKVLQNDERLRLQIFFPDMDKRIEVDHINGNYGYSGMWRILDWNERVKMELEEDEQYNNRHSKHIQLPPPAYSKKEYLKSLSEDTLVNITLHFNAIYKCEKLEEREMNMVWLSFLLGEGLLMLTESLIITNYNEVEFETKDYEVTIESETPGGINIELLSDYYALNVLYSEVLQHNKPAYKPKTHNV